MKKFLSLILALSLVMALCMTAFAATTGEEEGGDEETGPLSGGTVTAGSEVNVPVIDITLPNQEDIILNPYALTTMGEDTIDADQIQQDAMFLQNNSEVAVKVNLAVTGVLPTTNTDKVAFATATTVPATGKVAATTKSIFMYVDVQEVASTTGTETIKDYDAKANAATQILVAAKETKKDVAVLDGTAATNGKVYARIQVGGDMVSAPAVAWTANDAVSVKFVFDCTPTVRPAPAA